MLRDHALSKLKPSKAPFADAPTTHRMKDWGMPLAKSKSIEFIQSSYEGCSDHNFPKIAMSQVDGYVGFGNDPIIDGEISEGSVAYHFNLPCATQLAVVLPPRNADGKCAHPVRAYMRMIVPHAAEECEATLMQIGHSIED